MKRFFAILGTLPLLAVVVILAYDFIIDPMKLVFMGTILAAIAIMVLAGLCLEWLVKDFNKRKKPLDE